MGGPTPEGKSRRQLRQGGILNQRRVLGVFDAARYAGPIARAAYPFIV